ncbi:DUF742 domain-containing protein [Pseudonocardia sp. H11422]|uniref:DUF742 domain-containing protein n=1 Tax=Pseudonocardia sp. H11422 TaxID=2835866 RepID=UPI001BDC58E1|nr:DUF742 domain-containing protein [Pseudonocardia sp. H11422]
MSDDITEAGRVVPVYAVTGGRTRSAGGELPIEALVSVTGRAHWATDLQMEYRMILELAERPVSLVEIGAVLKVPVGVARVLVSDLADAGYLAVYTAPSTADGRPGVDVLERLLEGLRAR